MEADAKSGKGFAPFPLPWAAIIPARPLSAKAERGLQLVDGLAQAAELVLELRILVDDARALGPLLRLGEDHHASGRHESRPRHALVFGAPPDAGLVDVADDQVLVSPEAGRRDLEVAVHLFLEALHAFRRLFHVLAHAAGIPAIALRARIGDARLDHVTGPATERPDFGLLQQLGLEGRNLLVDGREGGRVLPNGGLALSGDKRCPAELAAL